MLLRHSRMRRCLYVLAGARQAILQQQARPATQGAGLAPAGAVLSATTHALHGGCVWLQQAARHATRNPLPTGTHFTWLLQNYSEATRVELPLMEKDEAVALLLNLANVDEAGYLKKHPGSAWPPQAAYTIAAECGLLPITLTIAAQVVR